jgi:hypothetical protein
MNLLSILKLDNVLKLKIATFTYIIINEDKNIPKIFTNIISTASTQHSYSTIDLLKNKILLGRKLEQIMESLDFTFRFISSKIWEAIPYHIKKSNSVSVFKNRYYSQFLIYSQI